MPPPLILRKMAEGGAVSPLDAFRKQYPDYNHVADDALAEALYKKFYNHVSRDEYYSKLGLKAPQEPNMAEDVARSAGSGLVGGATSIVGAVGDVAGGVQGATRSESPLNPFNAMRNAVGTAVFGSKETPEQRAKVDAAIKPPDLIPTTENIRNTIPGAKEAAAYEPKTDVGRYTKAGFELLPGAITLGGATTLKNAIGAATKLAAVPGVAGEMLADQAPEDWKPAMRLIGNVGGGASASILSNWARATTTNSTEAFKPLLNAATQMYNTSAKFNHPAMMAKAVRLGAKATILDRVMETARSKSSWTKPRAGEVRQGFKELDQQLTNTNSGLAVFFTPAEREIIKSIADGAPVENAMVAFAKASVDIRALIAGAAAAGGVSTWLSGWNPKALAAAFPAIAGLAALGTTARSSATLRQGEKLNQLSDTIFAGKPVGKVSVGHMNPLVIGNYAAPALVPLPPDMEDKYR